MTKRLKFRRKKGGWSKKKEGEAARHEGMGEREGMVEKRVRKINEASAKEWKHVEERREQGGGKGVDQQDKSGGKWGHP